MPGTRSIDAADTHRADPWVFHAVEWLRRDEARIFARTAARRERLRATRGLEGEALREALIAQIVWENCVFSSAVNGVWALPLPLPGGTWGGLALSLTGSVVGELVVMTEMVYGIAAAWDVPLRGEALREAAWRILHLAEPEDRRATAVQVGRRVATKKTAEKLASLGATRVFHLLRGVVHRPGSPADPGLSRAVNLAAVPAVMGVAWRDGQAVARRADAFFAEVAARSSAPPSPPPPPVEPP